MSVVSCEEANLASCVQEYELLSGLIISWQRRCLGRTADSASPSVRSTFARVRDLVTTVGKGKKESVS
jgi:hypothetical protein